MEPGGSNIGSIIVLVILVALSAFFSATETAFLSFNKARMKSSAKQGTRRAQLVLDLEEKYDKLLSTILIGNNIVNILASSLATVIFIGYFGDAGVTLSTVVMTVGILIFGVFFIIFFAIFFSPNANFTFLLYIIVRRSVKQF